WERLIPSCDAARRALAAKAAGKDKERISVPSSSEVSPKSSSYSSTSRRSSAHLRAASQVRGVISSPPAHSLLPVEREYLLMGPPLPYRKNSPVRLRYSSSRMCEKSLVLPALSQYPVSRAVSVLYSLLFTIFFI